MRGVRRLAPCGPSLRASKNGFPAAVERSVEARGVGRGWRLAPRDHARAVAVHLADRPSRPAAPGRVLDAASVRGQARDHRGALHLQMGDRRADRRGNRAGGAVVLAAVGVRGAGGDDHRLWRDAHPDGSAHPGARRHLREGGDERGAAARLPHLRAHAPALAALSSRAQDRRPDAGSRARPQCHRDHRSHGDHAARADHHRARADRGRAALPVRLALRRGHSRRRRALYGVHLQGDRVAHQHSPPDERQRHRGQRQGGRTRCSITRR